MQKLKKLLIGTLLAFMISTIVGQGLSEILPAQASLFAGQAYAQDCEYDESLEPQAAQAAYEDCLAAQDEEGGEGAGAGEPECASDDFDCLVGQLPPVKGPQKSTDPKDLANQVANLAAKTHRLFAPLINFFSFQIGNFLGHDYVYRGAMGQNLRKIWIISRNIVNIAFVFLLLWIALKEIFFVNRESELKGSLIKFTLLLVAVNFSWLGTKVVLDAANVVTHVVFAIPSGISGSPIADVAGTSAECHVNYGDAKRPISEGCYPSAVFFPVDAGTNPIAYWESSSDQGTNACDQVKEAYAKAYKSDGSINNDLTDSAEDQRAKQFQRRASICVENLNLFKYDQNTAVVYLTYGMARIQNLVHTAQGNDLTQLAIGTLMSLIIQLAYTVALLALFVALVIRMAMLWFFVGFSPFMVLVIWFSGAEDRDFGQFKFGFKEFANWAFVPARVGAVFAISFIMISAGQTATQNAALRISTLVDNLDAKSGFPFRLYDVQTLFHGMDNLQFFIWTLMSLVVLWLGVFAVLSKMSIVGTVTERINEMGKSAAKFIATTPYWAPVLPLGKGGEKVSVRQQLEGITKKGPIKDIMEAYRGKETTGDLERKVQRAAPRIDFGRLEQLYNGRFNRNTANQAAKMFGVRSLDELHQVDRKAVEAALRKHPDYDVVKHSKLLDDLYSPRLTRTTPETAEERSRRQKEQAEATEKGTETALRKAGAGGTGQGPAPGAAPPAPRPGGPAAPPGQPQPPNRNVAGPPGGGT